MDEAQCREMFQKVTGTANGAYDSMLKALFDSLNEFVPEDVNDAAVLSSMMMIATRCVLAPVETLKEKEDLEAAIKWLRTFFKGIVHAMDGYGIEVRAVARTKMEA